MASDKHDMLTLSELPDYIVHFTDGFYGYFACFTEGIEGSWRPLTNDNVNHYNRMTSPCRILLLTQNEPYDPEKYPRIKYAKKKGS